MITLTYINHINEVISFNVDSLFMTGTELHDYKWNYTTNNNRLNNFDRGVVEKKVNSVIVCKDRTKAVEMANLLMEITEKDVLNRKAGKIVFGDYYLTCYITASKKGNYIEKTGLLETELTIVTDSPAWVKENTKNYTLGSGESSSGKNLDYSFDFPYDFTSSSTVSTLVNPSFAGTDFKMVIYGPAVNPEVYINGHKYEVTASINQGQYVTIDSKKKTVIMTKNDGEEVNWFRYRGKDDYIFEKIASGENTVQWDSSSFGFDITLFEERSEPKWT